MISLYSGTPGSGKSLHCAYDIYWALRFGKLVIANFDINVSKIKNCKGKFIYIPNHELTVDKLISISREHFSGKKIKENQIYLFIDEAQMIFNARDWQKKDRNDWLYFFTHHRKYGFYIVLSAQFDRMLDRQIRCLLEYEYVHRKVANFGKTGFLVSLLTFGQLFVFIKMWYPIKEKIGSEFFRANKKYYSLYDTFDDFK